MCKDDKSLSAQFKLSLWPATLKKSNAKATYKLRNKHKRRVRQKRALGKKRAILTGCF